LKPNKHKKIHSKNSTPNVHPFKYSDLREQQHKKDVVSRMPQNSNKYFLSTLLMSTHVFYFTFFVINIMNKKFPLFP
jgi:hypothetical protein